MDIRVKYSRERRLYLYLRSLRRALWTYGRSKFPNVPRCHPTRRGAFKSSWTHLGAHKGIWQTVKRPGGGSLDSPCAARFASKFCGEQRDWNARACFGATAVDCGDAVIICDRGQFYFTRCRKTSDSRVVLSPMTPINEPYPTGQMLSAAPAKRDKPRHPVGGG